MKELLYEVRCLKSTDMILALAGQFKQLSHEPEKFRWLNGIRIPLSHLNFSGSWDDSLNCPASARIISVECSNRYYVLNREQYLLLPWHFPFSITKPAWQRQKKVPSPSSHKLFSGQGWDSWLHSSTSETTKQKVIQSRKHKTRNKAWIWTSGRVKCHEAPLFLSAISTNNFHRKIFTNSWQFLSLMNAY